MLHNSRLENVICYLFIYQLFNITYIFMVAHKIPEKYLFIILHCTSRKVSHSFISTSLKTELFFILSQICVCQCLSWSYLSKVMSAISNFTLAKTYVYLPFDSFLYNMPTKISCWPFNFRTTAAFLKIVSRYSKAVMHYIIKLPSTNCGKLKN